MTVERKLVAPAGYDVERNPRVASFAAQLDDQLTRLRRDVEGLSVAQLEWQPHPGMNTVGMLLAHLAVVDLWWMRMAPQGVSPDGSEADLLSRESIGITMDEDGLPLAKDGGHPAPLLGKSLSDYFSMLDRARAITHAELRRWRDADLSNTYARGDRVISYEWTVYHVLEHFAGHYGQILLLKHMMRDAGLLAS